MTVDTDTATLLKVLLDDLGSFSESRESEEIRFSFLTSAIYRKAEVGNRNRILTLCVSDFDVRTDASVEIT